MPGADVLASSIIGVTEGAHIAMQRIVGPSVKVEKASFKDLGYETADNAQVFRLTTSAGQTMVVGVGTKGFYPRIK